MNDVALKYTHLLGNFQMKKSYNASGTSRRAAGALMYRPSTHNRHERTASTKPASSMPTRLRANTTKPTAKTKHASDAVLSSPTASDRRSLIPPHWSDAPDRLKVSIEKVVIEDSISPRSGLDDELIAQLEEVLNEKGWLPPLTAFQMGGRLVLADGLHRLLAHQRHGSTHVQIERHHGPLREAELFALFANTRHGRRLSREEVRASIRKWLNDDEFKLATNTEIAQLCHCSPPTVAKVRKEREQVGEIGSQSVRRFRRGGRDVQMNTRNLGRKAADKAEQQSEPSVGSDDDDQPDLLKRVPTRPSGTSKPPRERPARGAQRVGELLDRIEEGIDEWKEPAKFVQALNSGASDRTFRRQFEKCARWFESVKAHLSTRTNTRRPAHGGRRTYKK